MSKDQQMTKNRKVLIVDDEVNLLRSMQRNLRKLYDLTIAEGGIAGLNQILEGGPFAVIVSDLHMKEVDGFQVLEMARIVTPDTVRIMLTGNVKGNIFPNGHGTQAWFQQVNKPCATERLCQMLNEGIDGYEMAVSARQSQSSALTTITLTVRIVEQHRRFMARRHDARERCHRLRQLSRSLGDSMKFNDTWQYELAGMLSQISCLVSSDRSESIDEDHDHDEAFLKRQAESSSDIIRRIPRLESIADMVRLQYAEELSSNVAGYVQRGSRILRMLTDYDILTRTMSSSAAIRQMESRSKFYGVDLFRKFSELILGTLPNP